MTTNFTAQHENDTGIGPWRYGKTGLFAYPTPNDPDRVWVVDTGVGEARRYSRGIQISRDYSRLTDKDRAAIAYFDAHPEPKPWHSAEPGEAWLLTINDEQAPAITFLDKNTGQTLFATPTFTDLEPVSPLITAGRRIWPDESAPE